MFACTTLQSPDSRAILKIFYNLSLNKFFQFWLADFISLFALFVIAAIISIQEFQ